MDVVELTKLIESKEFSSFILPFKVLALAVSFLFAYGVIYYFKDQTTIWNDTKRRVKDFLSFQRFNPPSSFVNAAKEISYLLNKKQYETAVLKTEILFIKVLKRFGYAGDDLAMIARNEQVPNNKELIKLSEIASNIRKERGYRVNPEEIEHLFESYEEALMRLGVLTKKHEE